MNREQIPSLQLLTAVPEFTLAEGVPSFIYVCLIDKRRVSLASRPTPPETLVLISPANIQRRLSCWATTLSWSQTIFFRSATIVMAVRSNLTNAIGTFYFMGLNSSSPIRSLFVRSRTVMWGLSIPSIPPDGYGRMGPFFHGRDHLISIESC